jgi:conserved domain protein
LNYIIEWCNTNTGFLTAILSIFSLLVSTIAIVVSVETARLPYNKKVLLSFSTDIGFFTNPTTGQLNSEIVGMSVNATNVGFRCVNITYLGISFKDKFLLCKQNKILKIRDERTGIGLIAPSEIKTESFKKDDLIFALSKPNSSAKVFLYAIDSEGQAYSKKIGRASDIVKSLSN